MHHDRAFLVTPSPASGEGSRPSLSLATRPYHARRTIAGTNCLIEGAPTCCIMV